MINICIIATIVIYLVGMLLVGFVYSKSNEDSSDFYLGGTPYALSPDYWKQVPL